METDRIMDGSNMNSTTHVSLSIFINFVLAKVATGVSCELSSIFPKSIPHFTWTAVMIRTIWMVFYSQYTTLYDSGCRSKQSVTFQSERDACLEQFTEWNDSDQVDFVEQLLARMSHYQHSHINAYLKPMLQRDFITLLPST